MQQKNHVYFVAVILKVLLVNLLAALNFADVFLNRKTFGKYKKTLKTFFENVFFASMLCSRLPVCERAAAAAAAAVMRWDGHDTIRYEMLF